MKTARPVVGLCPVGIKELSAMKSNTPTAGGFRLPRTILPLAPSSSCRPS